MMNKFTAHWTSIFYNESYIMRKELFKANQNFASEAKGKLLDFGCGDKPYRSLYMVDEYIGLDFAQTRHSASKDTDSDIVNYDGENIPFSDETFDVIISTEVFEHLFNLDNTLSEIQRVLKKDGKLFFTCPFSYGEHETPYDFARYTRFALISMLKRHGFQNIRPHRTGNMVAVICQYIALFNYYIVSKTWIFKPIFFVLFVTPFFLISNILQAIIPNKFLRPDVYLNNTVTCTKK